MAALLPLIPVERPLYFHTLASVMKISRLIATALVVGTPAISHAQLTNSPAGGTLPGSVSLVGGVVADLIGLNGTRVVSQLAASQLYVGFASANPQTIGTQMGFGPLVTGVFGGGLLRASFRFTLFDGDTGPGNFDDGDNTLQVNGQTVGNWSGVTTQRTDGAGAPTVMGTQLGFEDQQLHTGFFFTNNAAALAAIFLGMQNTGSLVYELTDTDPFDNFYDFTQGVDAGLIDVGQPPVVQPPTNVVPEPSTYALMAVGMAGIVFARRKRQA